MFTKQLKYGINFRLFWSKNADKEDILLEVKSA